MRAALAFSAALLLVTASAAAQKVSETDDCGTPPSVTVRVDRGVYSVAAEFHVPQSPSLARAVLTDYERIPSFMPGVESSVVIERGPGRVVIEQEAVSRLMMFSKHVHLQLEILEAPDMLQFRDRSASSFSQYAGMWRLCETGQGTIISYELVAQPAFDVPEFVLKKLLKRDSGQMIDGLRREIASRGPRG